MANNPNAVDNLKPFKKGDVRINRRGRPKSFDALRELAQSIAHEKITEVNGHGATVAEMILRKWASSPNPILQRAFIETAFGKVPDKLELTGADGGRLKIEAYEYNNAIAVITAGPGHDSETPSEG
jgi:hypothetical protein